MPSRGDLTMGRTAVERGYISPKIVRIYLKKVDEAKDAGRPATIEQLLLKDKILTKDQVRDLEKTHTRQIQFCPSCGYKHNVFAIEDGSTARCKRCKVKFLVQKVSGDIAPSGKEREVTEEALEAHTSKTRRLGRQEADELRKEMGIEVTLAPVDETEHFMPSDDDIQIDLAAVAEELIEQTSSSEIPVVEAGKTTAKMRPPPPDETESEGNERFYCPECGAARTLTDEECPACDGPDLAWLDARKKSRSRG